MVRFVLTFAALIFLVEPQSVCAGLYYSGEKVAELPAQWRGFLLDQRTLRNIAVKGTATVPESQARTRYLAAAKELQRIAGERKLSAEESADLGALYVRLGEVDKAVEVLRSAQRDRPNYFQIAANLGLAWQLRGDIPQAIVQTENAVRLAPGKFLQAEEYHLKLLRSRQKDGRTGDLDDLFGVRFVGENGSFVPGRIARAEKKKLPAQGVAIVQQLALWLPDDPQLLWQLAELANAHGDLRNAAAMFDGCVVQFKLDNKDLRRHRQEVRAAAEEQANLATKEPHKEKHAGTIAFRSKRPLAMRLDMTELPSISDTEINAVPWDVLSETVLEPGGFKPGFSKYLQELDGKSITMTGFMQPLKEGSELATFLFLENPVGCWYCEMPETSGILFVEMTPGKTAGFQRGLIRIVGRLTLNRADPEDFLYALRDARVTEVD